MVFVAIKRKGNGANSCRSVFTPYDSIDLVEEVGRGAPGVLDGSVKYRVLVRLLTLDDLCIATIFQQLGS